MAQVVDFGLQKHKIKLNSEYSENLFNVVAGDTGRSLEIQLLDSEGLVQNTTGLNLRLNAIVEDKATFTDATLIDAATGLYRLDLSNGMFLAPGHWQFQWRITDAAGAKLHGFVFMGKVGSNISEGGSQATNFYLNLEDLKAMQEDLVNGTIDSSILETTITEKLTDLETQYAPKLTEVTAQLAQTDTVKIGGGVLASMGDMGQDIKTAMTGGSVAVVGPGAVSDVNLANDLKARLDLASIKNNAEIISFGYAMNYVIDSTGRYLKLPKNTIIRTKTYDYNVSVLAEGDYASFKVPESFYSSVCALVFDTNTKTFSFTQNKDFSGLVVVALVWATYAKSTSGIPLVYDGFSKVPQDGSIIKPNSIPKSAINFDITTTSKWANKKVLIIGDSISDDTYGNYTKWATFLNTQGVFGTLTKSTHHATGFVKDNGTTFLNFNKRIDSITGDYDLIIVFGGVNDQKDNVPIGVSGGNYQTQFYPAVERLIQTLQTKFINATVVLATPLPYDHSIWFNNPNANGDELINFVDVLIEVCGNNGVPCLDLYRNGNFHPKIEGFNERWTLLASNGKGGFINDGLHPNKEFGEVKLAPKFDKFIQTV